MKDHESDHINNTKLYVGCLPCLLNGFPDVHADYHHAEAGRKRKAHKHGYGACLWHHRGERHGSFSQHSQDEIAELIGPSLQKEKRRFNDVYGGEALLVALNEIALSLWMMRPWLEHEMPLEIQQAIQAQHTALKRSMN
jgi:hypothetical protein